MLWEILVNTQEHATGRFGFLSEERWSEEVPRYQVLVWEAAPVHEYTGERILGFSSVQSLSRVRLFATPWSAAHQASLSITTPGVHFNSRPSSRWCHPAISSSVIPFSSCPQSLPASGSFPMSQLFAWGGQITGVSALASFLPKNTQDWSPLEWTGWISLQSKGLYSSQWRPTRQQWI